MSVKILNENEYSSSTVTMLSTLNRNLKTRIVAEYLPIVNLFDAKGKRIKLIPGTRNSIRYYGIEGIIITSCYKDDIRRGVRLGVMNNMICSDLQLMGKNVHIKISESIITSVGTKNFEDGRRAILFMIKHLNILKKNIEHFQSLGKEEQREVYNWIYATCIVDGKLRRLKDIEFPDHIDRRAFETLVVYIDDFEQDEVEAFREKIENISTMENIFDGELKDINFKIYNSVYHIDIYPKEDKKRLYLHVLAPYLASKGISVEFHNWISEGVIICFPIENNKVLNTNDKEYMHRFTVHERSSMRQCSPAYKDESYKYYKGVMKLIKEFVENGQHFDQYKQYITEKSLDFEFEDE